MAAVHVQSGNQLIRGLVALDARSVATQMQQCVHIMNRNVGLIMTWWQVEVGHATSQLVAQLSWQRLKCLQHATHVVYSTVAHFT